MKVIIVDENDTPVGLCERDEWKDGDIHRTSGVWISNSKGEILLARRALTKRHAAGKWGPAAAGTNEENETYESNAIKETEEEIGVVITSNQFELGPKELIGPPDNRRFRQWFMAKLDIPLESLKLQEDEVIDAKWIHWSEFEEALRKGSDDFVSNARISFTPLIDWTKNSL